MSSRSLLALLLVSLQLWILVLSRKECASRTIEGADSVCVCNSTYCDDIPPVVREKAGTAVVFESTKTGHRFRSHRLRVGSLNTCPRSETSANEVNITIDETKQYQKILGFGGAFTDSTGYMLNSVNSTLAAAIINSYFASNGIEYSFGRVPVSATDYSLRPYTYDDVKDDKNLTNFALQREDFEWKMPYIKMAQSVSPHNLKLIGSNWSPPAWMKVVEDLRAFVELKGPVGGEYYHILANYLLKFLEAYHQNGIEFWGLTTENEPVEEHGNPALKMTPNSLKVFVKNNLGPLLESSGYGKDKLNLLLMDEGLPFIKNWTDSILEDTLLYKYLSGIAIHWYYNDMLGSEVESILDYVHEKHPQLFVLNSEACQLDGPGNGKWEYAERYAFDVIKQLNHWSVAWLEWNMALDMKGGPTYFERHGCGGPVLIDPEAGEAYKQPSFYALGHLSKFVSPDSVRIERTVEGSSDLHVLTVKRPDNALVVVVLNRGNKQINLNIKSQSNCLTHKIGEHSIQSYIWWP